MSRFVTRLRTLGTSWGAHTAPPSRTWQRLAERGMLVLPGRSMSSEFHETVKLLYHQEIAKYHPDKVANLPREFHVVAEEHSRRINAAWEAFDRAYGNPGFAPVPPTPQPPPASTSPKVESQNPAPYTWTTTHSLETGTTTAQQAEVHQQVADKPLCLPRLEYFLRGLAIGAGGAGLKVLCVLFDMPPAASTVLALLLATPFFYYNIGGRLRHIGWEPEWAWLWLVGLFVPLLNIGIGLVLLFTPGKPAGSPST